jgi:ATP-dependent phosphofructokinase / diphosphate-dependent phosphofructokinase
MPASSHNNKKRIGLLTGGGDAPGLNGVIESCLRALQNSNLEVIGICDGFEGIYGQKTMELNPSELISLHARAGTLLGTSNKSFIKGREAEFLKNFREMRLDGLVAIGGDGTFSALSNVKDSVPMIGVPKTIDNDLEGTEVTFGYDTACTVVAESVEALRATADAHRRIIVVETMGRNAGWIALGGGLASYADVILLPERPFSRKNLLEFVRRKKSEGRRELMIVVSEGAMAEQETAQVAFRVEGSPEAERYGGIAQSISRWLEKETGWESRHVVLGHLQRARAPTVTDRFLTMTMGVTAARLVLEEKWQQAVVYREGRILEAPVTDLMKPVRKVAAEHRWVKMAQAIGLYI